MTENWGQWLRANFDKFLLLAMWATWITLIVLASRQPVDSEAVHWFRESADTVQGALMAMITGVAFSHRDPPPGTVSQVTTKTTVQEVPNEQEKPKV